jgi:hypothetical protein
MTIELTRAEFKEKWGITPRLDVSGIRLHGANGELIAEYLFLDELIPNGINAQLRELERLIKL